MPGYFYKSTRIKEDAVPIDNVTKLAWDDDDFEEYEEWHEYTEEELANFEENDRLHEFIENAPDIQAAQDAAICELYEQNLAIQAESDAAICSLYELMIGG